MSNATLDNIEQAAKHLAIACDGVQRGGQFGPLAELDLARKKITDAMNTYKDFFKKKRR